ncbi:MAG: DUF2208 domain-containing protein [Crenarchaeota archaeon]|nr:DUF2208 domain-containing protein [Thermoproteota archaeon]
MFNRLSTILLTYVIPAISIVVISFLSALAAAYNSPIYNYIIIGYIAALFIAFMAQAGLTFRRKMKEVREYVKNVKHGAVERLASQDLMKLIEKDSEYISEITKIQKKQFKNILIVFGILMILVLLYMTVLGRFISMILATVSSKFWRAFLETFIYFSILIVIYIAMMRVLKLTPSSPGQMMLDIPYAPMRSLVVYKDAIILDDIYLLKAPIKAKKVIINEKRRFIEIELDEEYAKKVGVRRVRLYVKAPKELWNECLSKIVQVTGETQHISAPTAQSREEGKEDKTEESSKNR